MLDNTINSLYVGMTGSDAFETSFFCQKVQPAELQIRAVVKQADCLDNLPAGGGVNTYSVLQFGRDSDIQWKLHLALQDASSEETRILIKPVTVP